MYQYIIHRDQGGICSYLIDQETDRTVEIHPENETKGLRVGQIYLGRVRDILPDLNAAFVQIRSGEPACYLDLENAKNPLYTKKGKALTIQQGDELAVQVKQEAIKGKSPALTAELTLQGKYVVLCREKHPLRCSKKLSAQERGSLRALFSSEEERCPYGILLRTNAGGAPEEAVLREIAALEERLLSMEKTAPHRMAGHLLYAPSSPWLAALRDLRRKQPLSVITNDSELFSKINELSHAGGLASEDTISFYEDPLLPLEKKYSLRERMRDALARQVWLPSGGALVIEPTEAMTVIDVNTAKCVIRGRKAQKEQAMLRLNLEAAKEVARQIRLRNMSGMILVDFINMESEASDRELLSFLERLLREDPVHTVLADMTKLKLVEITRQKIQKPLWEALQF